MYGVLLCALWPAAWLLDVDKSRKSKSAEVQRVWEVYDDRLQCMAQADAARLGRATREGDVSAWVLWSSAAEAALADAYRFAGGPILDRGLVLGLGTARCRVVGLGGPRVPKVRGNAVDPLEGDEVHMCRDSSVALPLGLRRRLRVVVDVLGNLIRGGFILVRSLELSAQCRAGLVHPISAVDLLRVHGG